MVLVVVQCYHSKLVLMVVLVLLWRMALPPRVLHLLLPIHLLLPLRYVLHALHALHVHLLLSLLLPHLRWRRLPLPIHLLLPLRYVLHVLHALHVHLLLSLLLPHLRWRQWRRWLLLQVIVSAPFAT